MSESRQTSRDDILDAAQRVAGRDGADNLTLDRVACECGLSKGGVLYNFPNKDALLNGMLDRLLQQHQQIMHSEEQVLAGEPDACIKAMLRAMANHQTADPSVYLSLLAAAAQKPELLEPVKALFRSHYERIQSECRDPHAAMLLWAAADGLLFHAILGIAPYTDGEKNVLFQKLLEHSGALS